MNIIDSLFVSLGIDASGMTKGAKDAEKAHAKIGQDAEKTQKKITAEEHKANKERELSAKKAGEALAKVRNEVLGLMTAYFGLNAVIAAGEKTISKGAQTSFKSGALGISATDLAAWKGAAEEFNASAEDVEATFSKLNALQTGLQAGEAGTISTFQSYAQILAAKSHGEVVANTSVLMDKNADSQAVLLELAKETSQLSEKDAVQALSRLGISEDMARAIHSGNIELARSLDMFRKLHPDLEKASKESRKLTIEWERFKNHIEGVSESMLISTTPALEWILATLEKLASWAAAHIPATTVIVGALTVALTALGGVSLLGGIGVTTAALTKMVSILGAAGLVGAAGAAGYAIGTVLNYAIDALITKLTGANATLGTFIYDVMHPGEPAGFSSAAARSSASKKGAAGSKGSASDITAFEAMGWTHEQASGIAANLLRESGGNEHAVGDNGQAYGLAQWHPDRQRAFAKWAGHDIRSATRAEQLAFVNYELRSGNEQAAGKRLSQTTSASEAGAVVSKYYERPGATVSEASVRGMLASNLSSINNNSSSNSQQVETNINGPIYVNAPQAKTNGDVAGAIGEKLQSYAFAGMANQGLQ